LRKLLPPGFVAAEPVQANALQINEAVLRTWIEQDVQGAQTCGQPGFMDIFKYLHELGRNLRERAESPDLVILSGRTTRLPCLHKMTANALELPGHRVRLIDDLLPPGFRSIDFHEIDKLAVVHGAQRFLCSQAIRFVSLPDEDRFNRYIGTIRE